MQLQQTRLSKTKTYFMSKQMGLHDVRENIGYVIYYTRNGKLCVRRKPDVSKSRRKTNRPLTRWTANCMEFASAGKTGKLLRDALQSQLYTFADHTMIIRLNSTLLNVILSDRINERGLRRVRDGNLPLLENFHFNSKRPLTSALQTEIHTQWNRRQGKASITTGSFIPAIQVLHPQTASHFMLSAIAVTGDFDKGKFHISSKCSDQLLCNTTQPVRVELTVEIKPGSIHPMLLLLHVGFFRIRDNGFLPIKNGEHDALTIVSTNNT
jgi:hypothetical protein